MDSNKTSQVIRLLLASFMHAGTQVVQFRVTRHLESFCLVDFFQRNLQSPRNVFGDPINISKKVLWSSERDNRDDKIMAIIK